MASLRLRRNADPQLREAERAYAAGDVDAGVAYLQHLMRIGRLNQAGLNQLSILGDRAARAMVPEPEVDGWRVPPIEDWFEFLGVGTAFSMGASQFVIEPIVPGAPTAQAWRANYLYPSGYPTVVRLALAASRGAAARYWLKGADSKMAVETYRRNLLGYIEARDRGIGASEEHEARREATHSWTPWSILGVVDQLESGVPYKLGTFAVLRADEDIAVLRAEAETADPEGLEPWGFEVAAAHAAYSVSSLAACVLSAPDVGEDEGAGLAQWTEGALGAIEEALRATHVLHPIDTAWRIVTKDIQKEVIPWLVS